jgi:predicted TIM-barrel fold metal-dependent hydrolase
VKLDAFNHIFPRRFVDAVRKRASGPVPIDAPLKRIPALMDLDARFRIMDLAPDYRQILSLANPPIDSFLSPGDALELSRIANDELAELVQRHPDRFAGAVASVPLTDVEGAVAEIDRAVRDLGLRGIMIFTDVRGRPLDDPEFEPVFAAMARHDLPILLHPVRGPSLSDYPSESESKREIWRVFGWLYDTVAAMTRIIFSGAFDRHPGLKILTHHLGGFVPYAGERVREGYSKVLSQAQATGEPLAIARHPFDYYKMFYADTITIGSVPALECGLAFFGAERVLFATDMPFDTEGGVKYVREGIRAMEEIELPAADKRLIYEENARRLFRL